jgi:cytochrome c-type biogenesis protein
MGGAFVAGALAILTPGLAPLLPGYAAFIAARSLAPAGPRSTKIAALTAAAGFIAGFSVAFVALSASSTALSQYLIARLDFFSNLAGVVVVLFGLLIAMAIRTGGPLGAFVLGLSFGFGWTPTVSPGLAAILVTAAQPDSLGLGLARLSSYALGLAVSLLLAALIVHFGVARMPRYHRAIAIVSGVLIAGAGVLIFTNR